MGQVFWHKHEWWANFLFYVSKAASQLLFYEIAKLFTQVKVYDPYIHLPVRSTKGPSPLPFGELVILNL